MPWLHNHATSRANSRQIIHTRKFATEPQGLLTAAFADGQIVFGGLVPPPEVGDTGRFGILGGTNHFRNARGEATLVVTSPERLDVTFEIDQPVWP